MVKKFCANSRQLGLISANWRFQKRNRNYVPLAVVGFTPSRWHNLTNNGLNIDRWTPNVEWWGNFEIHHSTFVIRYSFDVCAIRNQCAFVAYTFQSRTPEKFGVSSPCPVAIHDSWGVLYSTYIEEHTCLF